MDCDWSMISTITICGIYVESYKLTTSALEVVDTAPTPGVVAERPHYEG